MWTQLTKAKWYWFIPILSVLFFYRMSIWMDNGNNMTECNQRFNVILWFSIFPNMGMTLILLNHYS